MPWPRVKGTVLLQGFGSGAEEKRVIAYAAGILRAGGLVAFPTETVYGLGADALNPRAVAGIFRAKRRPADNPLIVHLAKREQIFELAARVPPQALLLGQQFWPGPLTMVLPKKNLVPGLTTAGLSSVALRLPSHPLALKLISAANVPVAAPSANLSGRPSPTKMEHVLEDMVGRIDAILDGGECSLGLESTVLSLLTTPPLLLRPGGITLEMLQETLGQEIIDVSGQANYEKENTLAPLSPGLKYRHYAPKAPLYLVEGPSELQRKQIMALSDSFAIQGCRVGLLLSEETKEGGFPAAAVEVLGPKSDYYLAGRRLYEALRRFDELRVDVIVAEGFEEKSMGRAVLNRLRKAATRIFRVE